MFGRWRKKKWPEPDLDRIKREARILVIDDQEFAYKKLFQRDGYNIIHWTDVDDLSKLEQGEFEVVLLDIQGVGKEISAKQGLGVLEHVLEVNPTQIIVAFSGDDYKLEKQDFFRRADAVLGKSQDYLEFKRCVDQLLIKRFTLNFYLEKVVEYAKDDAPIDELTREAKKAILKRDPGYLKEYLEKRGSSSKVIDRVFQIVQTAIAALSVLLSG